MQQSMAILKLNLRLLIKDKISLLWGIVLPTVMLLINIRNFQQESDLVYWWVYIVFTAYLYGVGLHALNEKDSGILAFIFSIKWISFQYFLGCLYTQIIFAAGCIAIFNIIASLLLGFNFFTLCMYGFLSLIICIPVAFFSYNFTYIKGLYSSSINSICNVLVFAMFISMGYSTIFNQFNPLFHLSQVQFQIINNEIPFVSLLLLLLIIVISIPSILIFKPVSIESR